MKRAPACDSIVAHIVEAIGLAEESSDPFPHLRLRNFFPVETYAAMVEKMPGAQVYRPMSGRARQVRESDGAPTRTKLHLLPEFVQKLPSEQRDVWSEVGAALHADAVRLAFARRLAHALEERFAKPHDRIGLYPIAMLTRDVAGYHIGIHADTPRKGITVQLYLPRDESIRHAGTQFHRQRPDGAYERAYQAPFVPNSGYAFAVTEDSYHSLDALGPEVATRDSILLTYFVDDTPWQVTKNRANRIGNWLAHSALNLKT